MPSRSSLALLVVFVATAFAPTPGCTAQPAAEPTAGVRKLHGDLQFTEGPASDGQGNVYFTDVQGNRIYKHTQDGKLEVFLEPSGHCNGLMFDAAGTLHACSMDGKLIAIDTATGGFRENGLSGLAVRRRRHSRSETRTVEGHRVLGGMNAIRFRVSARRDDVGPRAV